MNHLAIPPRGPSASRTLDTKGKGAKSEQLTRSPDTENVLGSSSRPHVSTRGYGTHSRSKLSTVIFTLEVQ